MREYSTPMTVEVPTTGNLTAVKNGAAFDFGVAMLPANVQPGSPTGGGNFYLFYKSQTDPSTRVFELDGKTGNVEEIMPDTGRYIVGAGVSTCAPTQQM